VSLAPFVQWTLAQGYCGLENLSLIPGTVGAAPMQNVGAYGVEIKDVFAGLTALDRETGELRDFSLAECAFGYRDSLFKRNPGRWLILRVRFALTHVQAHLDYGPVRQRLTEQGVSRLRRRSVMRSAAFAARSCRTRPSLAMPGASSRTRWCRRLVEQIRAQYPAVVAYPQADGQVKLAAGWLIEQAGWKGIVMAMPACIACSRWCWSTMARRAGRRCMRWRSGSRRISSSGSGLSWRWSLTSTDSKGSVAANPRPRSPAEKPASSHWRGFLFSLGYQP
jgi:UDP-N-acetylenolpyruvoylglucosamine reductase